MLVHQLLEREEENEKTTLLKVTLIFNSTLLSAVFVDLQAAQSLESVICMEPSTSSHADRKRAKHRKLEMSEFGAGGEQALPSDMTTFDYDEPVAMNSNSTDDIEVVALKPEVIQDVSAISQMGAYKPRWVKKKQKQMQQSGEHGDGGLTLADLLFVRGNRREFWIYSSLH